MSGVYRTLMERHGKLDIWIVDGARIREAIYPEFVYGGNAQRYLFSPTGEIWIDNAISAQEYKYTLAHELYERDLMAQKGLSYGDAHDSALMLENRLRHADSIESAEHERALPFVSTYDDDTIKELPWLPDSVKLQNVYLEHIGDRDGNEIWIVDGARIRRDLYPDFGFSGNDLVYYFIPRHEIWIDNAISCEETEYSITSESIERAEMATGKDYDTAYEDALTKVITMRKAMRSKAERHGAVAVPATLDRDIGTGDEAPASQPSKRKSE